MKKLILAILLILGVSLTVAARDNYTRDVKVLPEAARATLKTHFKAEVSKIESEWKAGRICEYEVKLSDGCEIVFDSAGNWKEIEGAAKKSIPRSIVPQGIARWVSKNQKEAYITGIERKRGGYEVELSNGVDAKFDKDGRFLQYD